MSENCVHVPTSPGQTMCKCEDLRMNHELTIEMLCRHVARLERRLQTRRYEMVLETQQEELRNGSDKAGISLHQGQSVDASS